MKSAKSPARGDNRIRYQAASDQKLETTRLWLEPLLASHAAKLFDSLQDEALTFIGRPPSLAALEEQYRKWEARGPGDGEQVWLNWAAKDKETNKYIGWFQATVKADRTTHFSYVVFPPYWRRGYSTEACREMIAHLIEVYAPALFVVEMGQTNTASVAMAEKLGFLRSGNPAPNEFRYEMQAKNWPEKS